MNFYHIIPVAAVAVGVSFALYNLFHYVLFLLVTHPRPARNIGHDLNEFEQRQLVEWRPRLDDFLKHDDEQRTYDDVFGAYRGEQDNYSSCVFPRTLFANPMTPTLYCFHLVTACECWSWGVVRAPRRIISPAAATWKLTV